MAKHTSGPWVIHLTQRVCVRPANSDTLLARAFGSWAKAEANARLIAAAPELLEACAAALAYDAIIQRIAAHGVSGVGDDDLDALYADLIEKSRAAIAKAEGKEAQHDQ